MSKTDRDGTRHKVFTTKYYLMYGGDKEICVVCGRMCIMYEHDKRLVIDEEFLKNYPLDILSDKYIYHTCSEPCKNMFNLNPLVYI